MFDKAYVSFDHVLRNSLGWFQSKMLWFNFTLLFISNHNFSPGSAVHQIFLQIPSEKHQFLWPTEHLLNQSRNVMKTARVSQQSSFPHGTAGTASAHLPTTHLILAIHQIKPMQASADFHQKYCFSLESNRWLAGKGKSLHLHSSEMWPRLWRTLCTWKKRTWLFRCYGWQEKGKKNLTTYITTMRTKEDYAKPETNLNERNCQCSGPLKKTSQFSHSHVCVSGPLTLSFSLSNSPPYPSALNLNIKF